MCMSSYVLVWSLQPEYVYYGYRQYSIVFIGPSNNSRRDTQGTVCIVWELVMAVNCITSSLI